MTPPTKSESNVTALHELEQRSGDAAYQTPPHNYEAEQALLGAIIENNLAYESVSELLAPHHFAEPVHGRIYEAIGKLVAKGQAADLITLHGFFERDGSLAEIGGPKYLSQLVGSVVTLGNVPDYARTIQDLWLRRQLIGVGRDLVARAYDADVEASGIQQLERTESELSRLAHGAAPGGPQHVKVYATEALEAAEQAYKREGRLIGLSTGLTALDEITGGLHRGEYTVLAGRPSMGKSALAANICTNVARGGPNDAGEPPVVAIFTLETSGMQLAMRMIAEQAEISLQAIRCGRVRQADFKRVVDAAWQVGSVPIFVDDTPAVTVAALRSRARRIQRQFGLALVVVDYLQLMAVSRETRRRGDVEAVSEISRDLAAMLKELKVPGLILSQLSRELEKRDDKRPQLPDLRNSGAIEQDADGIWMMFREDYYLERMEPPAHKVEARATWEGRMAACRGKVEIGIPKQRHGPIGRVVLNFNPETQRFWDDAGTEQGNLL